MMINNLKNDSVYIYNLNQYTKKNFNDIYTEIYNSLKTSNTNIDICINDTHCEIYEDLKYIKKGWVYNSSSTKKTVLFTIKPIPVLNKGSNSIETHKFVIVDNKKPNLEICLKQQQLSILTSELKTILTQPNYGLKNIKLTI